MVWLSSHVDDMEVPAAVADHPPGRVSVEPSAYGASCQPLCSVRTRSMIRERARRGKQLGSVGQGLHGGHLSWVEPLGIARRRCRWTATPSQQPGERPYTRGSPPAALG